MTFCSAILYGSKWGNNIEQTLMEQFVYYSKVELIEFGPKLDRNVCDR